MRNVIKSVVSIAVIVAIVLTACLPFNEVNAAVTKRPTATKTETIKSSNTYTGEYFKIRTPLKEKNTIYVSGKVKKQVKMICIRIKKHKSNKIYIQTFVRPSKNGEFSIKINTKKGNKRLPKVISKKGRVVTKKECRATYPGGHAVPKMTAGTYHLSVTAAVTKSDANVKKNLGKIGTLSGKEGYIYDEAVFSVARNQGNNLKLVKYNTIIDNNNKIRAAHEEKQYHIDSYKGSYVLYKDPFLTETPFVLYNPKTKKYDYMTVEQVEYINRVARQVTKGAKTNYAKALKIYEYVGKNTYYDKLALSKHKNQYAHPYKNLYNMRNGKKSSNTVRGKMATTCQGYASMVVAMSRSLGIPARFASGRHIRQPRTIWNDVPMYDMNTVTHYWPELYINGKWRVVDARCATRSSWSRKTFSSIGTWNKKDFITYSHFDPTDAQLSNSYIYTRILPGSHDGKFMNRKSEVNQLKQFLDSEYDGVSNGEKMNSQYKPTSISTWGIAADENDLRTDGYGRVSKIKWYDYGLYGALDLSNFAELRILRMSNNKLDSINLKGCSNLTTLMAKNNNLKTVDCSASSNVQAFDLRGNKLKYVKFKHKNRNVIVEATEGGSFAVKYNKTDSDALTIYAQTPSRGYKYDGIYNYETGDCLSKKYTCTLKPSAAKYVVKYEKVYDIEDLETEIDEPKTLESIE